MAGAGARAGVGVGVGVGVGGLNWISSGAGGLGWIWLLAEISGTKTTSGGRPKAR